MADVGGARAIRRLDPDVVNRIAAGEVIHRPANAIKELIENCLDAGATSVSVVAKGGGLKLLQITDNGHGIRKGDMDIVCERFTTSKLASFDDLRSIATYGFRGEALASISHVAHLTILSMTEDAACAHKAKYADGKLVPLRPGGPAKPKPCAGVKGTQITVEDLFYNVVTRKRALKNINDEYNKILNVVIRYATHNPHVAFSCKKVNSASADVQTLGGTTDQLGVLKLLYRNAVARELVEVAHTSEELHFSMSAWISNPNFNRKKGTFIFFINHRLVEVPTLKRALDETYAKHLPKHTHPFIYLSLEVQPENVDVNVHPTKKEVHFLNETEIIAAIQVAVDARLQKCESSRTYALQPQASPFRASAHTASSPSAGPSTPYQHQLVRTDSKARPLTAFFPPSPAAQPAESRLRDPSPAPSSSSYEPPAAATSPPPSAAPHSVPSASSSAKRNADMDVDDLEALVDAFDAPQAGPPSPSSVVEIPDEPMDGGSSSLLVKRPRSAMEGSNAGGGEVVRKQQRVRKYKPVLLSSVRALIAEMEAKSHEALAEVFFNYTFVGCANPNFALVQHATKMYLMNVCALSRELFYQVGLRRFSNFGAIRLSSPPPISELILLALEAEESGWTEEDVPKEEIAEEGSQLLVARRRMLHDYFSIDLDEDGNLSGLPQIIDNYVPPLERLPMFVMRLCTEVDWLDEKPCLRGIVQELSLFYQLPVVLGEQEEENGSNGRAWTVEHILFPALRTEFSAPRKFAEDRTVVQVACLEKLYKVFERC